jgi:hypothetical protein
MGKLLNGPQGQVTGLVGNNISYILNGQNVIRIKASKTRKLKNMSLSQKSNCQKLKVINSMFKDILPLLKAGFTSSAQGTRWNYHNLAMSYNKLHALKNEYPRIKLNYSEFRISSGDLPMPLLNTATLTTDGIRIDWSFAPRDTGVHASDQTMILLHFPQRGESFSFIYGQERQTKTQLIPLPDEYRTSKIEAYLSFVSADRTRVATSIYLGRLN